MLMGIRARRDELPVQAMCGQDSPPLTNELTAGLTSAQRKFVENGDYIPTNMLAVCTTSTAEGDAPPFQACRASARQRS